jgi:hypothetical protein
MIGREGQGKVKQVTWLSGCCESSLGFRLLDRRSVVSIVRFVK